LALATAISSWINALWLLHGLVNQKVYRRSKGWGVFIVRVLLANVVMISLIYWLQVPTEQWFEMDVWSRASALSQLVVFGVSTYFTVLIMSGLNLKRMLGGVIKH
jgi:putative peptidoglycan lipid II flippase